MQNYKFLKERIENLGGNDFLDTSWKVQYMKESLTGWISLKVKTSLLPKTLSRKWEDRLYMAENICKRHIKQRTDIQYVQRDLKSQQKEN